MTITTYLRIGATVGLDGLGKLLKGAVLVMDIAAPTSRRAWIEVALHDDDMPPYSLRTPPYAMTSISSFQQQATRDSRFKVRTSSFDADEIRQGLDPSYDDVGVYVVVDSLQALNAYLAERGVALDDFVESSQTDYPL